ncbi:MAG: aldehyde dehydrogenase [Crocinitomicaceae bacterium]|jgi:NADP-dependent aldehyde dehydrogenase|nr:aldehyde dehydrogenase [Crocinitomicaceae bacterium]
MHISGKNRVGYTEPDAFAYTFRTFDPKQNRENDFDIFGATDADIEAAVQKAADTFLEFSNLPGKRRAEFLLRIAEKLLLEKESLISIYCLESALPEGRALIELKRTIHQLHEFAELISVENWNFSSSEPADPNRAGNPKPSLHKYFKALGPVVVFGASNFPFAYSTIGGDSASALAAGCPVIVKAHVMHAGTGNLVARLVSEAARETGMPDGIFSNLNALGNEAGEKLVLHPKIKAVGFTGSFKGGMALYKLAQNRPEPIPVFAEMGSVNPVFLFEGAFQQPGLVHRISQSISLNAGQFCTNPGLIFLQKSEASGEFIAALAKSLENLEPQSMLHPQILKNYTENASRLAENKSIINLVETNNKLENKVQPLLRQTTAQDFLQNHTFQEEVFGSHTLIVVLDDKKEFLTVARHLDGQLTLSIFAAENELQENIDFLRVCEQKAGRLIWNGVPTGVEVCRAMNHGGPFPATTDARFTAVGKDAVYRFLRPLAYQNFSLEILRKLIS